jgi:hemoglobin
MTSVTIRVLAIMVASLCGASAAVADGSLYTRLGGDAGVAAISNALVDRAVADPVMGPSFKDSKLSRIKTLLAEQICDLSGGPCHYSGDPMKEVHAGHHITEAQFYRMVDALRGILKARHVDQRSTNQLLRLLAPMKRDVVEHGSAENTTAPKAPGAAAAPAAAGVP